jgi:hypothetical protein
VEFITWGRQHDLDQARRRQIEVLRGLAHTEDGVAHTFERLAATGDPQQRARREFLAEQARAGAEKARHRAQMLEADLRRS